MRGRPGRPRGCRVRVAFRLGGRLFLEHRLLSWLMLAGRASPQPGLDRIGMTRPCNHPIRKFFLRGLTFLFRQRLAAVSGRGIVRRGCPTGGASSNTLRREARPCDCSAMPRKLRHQRHPSPFLKADDVFLDGKARVLDMDGVQARMVANLALEDDADAETGDNRFLDSLAIWTSMTEPGRMPASERLVSKTSR